MIDKSVFLADGSKIIGNVKIAIFKIMLLFIQALILMLLLKIMFQSVMVRFFMDVK